MTGTNLLENHLPIKRGLSICFFLSQRWPLTLNYNTTTSSPCCSCAQQYKWLKNYFMQKTSWLLRKQRQSSHHGSMFLSAKFPGMCHFLVYLNIHLHRLWDIKKTKNLLPLAEINAIAVQLRSVVQFSALAKKKVQSQPLIISILDFMLPFTATLFSQRWITHSEINSQHLTTHSRGKYKGVMQVKRKNNIMKWQKLVKASESCFNAATTNSCLLNCTNKENKENTPLIFHN